MVKARMAELRIRAVPEPLRRELKSAAALEGTSLNQLVIDLLTEALAARGKRR